MLAVERLAALTSTEITTQGDPEVNNPRLLETYVGVSFGRWTGPLAKMDLRMEGGFTASEDNSLPNGINYWKEDYRDGYTNKGLLISDTMGRAGVTWQAWTMYWISPRDKVQVSYRNEYVSPQFLSGSGTQNDISRHLELSAETQLGSGAWSAVGACGEASADGECFSKVQRERLGWGYILAGA
jgi:hypothetical protein